jgi:hypothetical protein
VASTDIDVSFQSKFRDDFILQYQQLSSKLRDAVDTDFTQDGAVIYFDFIGTASVRKRVTVAEATQHNPPPHSRRLIRPNTYKADAYLSDVDIQKMGRSPQNKWMQAFVAAHARNCDDVIIAAANGNAVSADENLAETTIALPAGQKIAVAAAGLNLAKVAEAKYRLDLANVPLEDRHAVIGPIQESNLLNEAKATSRDYVSNKILEKGSIEGETWMGFTWRLSNRLTADASSDRLCLFYHKQAIGLWCPMDVKSDIAKDPSRSFDWAMVVQMSCSATRIQDAGVVQVACDEP